MTKMAYTIYNKAIQDAIMRGSGGKVDYYIVLKEFLRYGFTEKKAVVRIKEQAELNGHNIKNGEIHYL